MGKSSKNQGFRWVGNPPGGVSNVLFGRLRVRQELGPAHYDLSSTALPSIPWSQGHKPELLTISEERHGAAILLTDQRDGSEKVSAGR
jgi:hypothetical protein